MNTFDPTVTVASLERPVNRRHLLKMLGIGTAALAVGAGMAECAGAQIGTHQHTSQLYTVSTAANFRAGPTPRPDYS